MLGGEGGNHFLLVFKVAIDQSDADPGLAADVVHAGLVKPAFGKAMQGRGEDLLAAVEEGVIAFCRHEDGDNE